MNRRLSVTTHLTIGLLFAIMIGLPVLLFIDMLTNRGNAVAKGIHHQIPECSSSCHQ